MKKQLTRFSVHQSSKFLAVLYFILAAIFCIPAAAIVGFSNEGGHWGIWLVIPVVYLILTYIVSAIIFWIYNGVASVAGGLEFELEDR